MIHNPYYCQECDGDGEIDCVHCGSLVECESCGGNSYDDDKLDVARFLAAEQALQEKFGLTCAWIVDGVWLGRMAIKHPEQTIAYKDFARVVQ